MRMIGIGLLGFLLAGIALLLSSMNILDYGRRYVHDLTGGTNLVFEHRTATPAQDPHEAIIMRSGPDTPILLSGFPAYQSLAFYFPSDARPTSGYLQIDATSQILAGVEGVLRISINNARRAEMLLHSGEAGRSLQIPLSPGDFAGDRLVVSLSLQGAGPNSPCGPQDRVAAIVEIETTSAIYLTLEQPLSSASDQIRAWGNVVNIAWPSWLTQDEQLRRLVLATQFERRNLTTVFKEAAQDGFTTTQLRDALSKFPMPEPSALEAGYWAHTGANSGLRRFHRQAAWRSEFELGAGGSPRIPSQLDLNMVLGRLVGEQPWSITVTLNKRLVFQDHLTGRDHDFHAVIELPAEIQTNTNTLEVLATASNQQDGVCDQGPELVAEMLPSTRLIPGETSFVDPLSQVHIALRDVGLVNIAMTSAMTTIDASIASRMLNTVIPEGTEFKPAGNRTDITVMNAGDRAPALPDIGPAWLVTSDSTGGGVTVERWQPDDGLSLTGVSLLITPRAIMPSGIEG